MPCYHLYNLKNVNNHHRGMLLLVKLQALGFGISCNAPDRLNRHYRYRNSLRKE